MVDNIWGKNALVGGTGGSGGTWQVTTPQLVQGHVGLGGNVVDPYIRMQQSSLVGGGIDPNITAYHNNLLNQQGSWIPQYTGENFVPQYPQQQPQQQQQVPQQKAPPRWKVSSVPELADNRYNSKEEAQAAYDTWWKKQPKISFVNYPDLGKFHTDEEADAALAKHKKELASQAEQAAEAEQKLERIKAEREAKEETEAERTLKRIRAERAAAKEAEQKANRLAAQKVKQNASKFFEQQAASDKVEQPKPKRTKQPKPKRTKQPEPKKAEQPNQNKLNAKAPVLQNLLNAQKNFEKGSKPWKTYQNNIDKLRAEGVTLPNEEEPSFFGKLKSLFKNEGGPMKDLNDPSNRDTVPAMLTEGEFVLNKEATAMFGPLIQKMNDHGLKQRHTENQMVQANIGKKISKLHGEGYKAPGLAYAIAKSTGYNTGGLVDFLKEHELSLIHISEPTRPY